MRKLFVGENDKNQRLDKFMQKTFKTMSQPMLYKYIRKKCVRVNGVHAVPDTIIRLGDELTFYIADEYFEKGEADYKKVRPSFGVVYEDENILIIDKPAGLICQPDSSESLNTLSNHVKAYLFNKNEYRPEAENAFAPALCNRIDKNTQGLVIAAKNAEALAVMNEKIKNREVEKYYQCLVYGCPTPASALLSDFLFKDEKTNRVIVSSERKIGYREIKTEYTVLATNGKISLLSVHLLTGRTHQIRAHMAYIGHPLLGDGKYGKIDKTVPFRYQALSSCKISFNFLTSAECLDYLNRKTFETKPFFADYDIVTKLSKI